MNVYIDGDGCPVVDIVIENCKNYQVPCLIVCNTAHVFNKEYATTITVSKGENSADFEIVKRIVKGDLVITQDYGLAAICLSKQVRVLREDGLEYTNFNIDSLLFQRYSAQKLRKSGKRVKGKSKRTVEEDVNFEKSLQKILKECIKKPSEC